MNFIAVDIGSTFVKSAIFDLTHCQVLYTEKYHTPPRRNLADPFLFENDARDFLELTKQIIRKCWSISGDIMGVLFSTQQHGCVLCHPQLEKDTYISWQDTRCLKHNPKTGQSYLEDLEELLPTSIMRSTGVPVKPALALCNLYALFESENLSRQGDIRVYTLGAYLIEHLTGNNICHVTNAAPMGFANVLENSWDHGILRRVGLDFLRLPQITASLECCGYYCDGDIRIPVYPDVGDVQTSVYGTGARAGDMVINIGTSGQLVYLSDRYSPGSYEIRPYYDGNYCYVISRMPGGRNFDVQIDYLRDVGRKIFNVSLSREEVWTRLETLVKSEDSHNLEVNCGFYELPDRPAGGSICHIDHVNFVLENVINATASDFGRQYRHFADLICPRQEFSGTLYFAGGAVQKSPVLMSAISREMKIPKVIAAPKDEIYGGMFRLAQMCATSVQKEGILI